MNSIAPIISLSETVSERAAQNGVNEKDYKIMLQAVEAIHRRSKGLLDFVQNYRQLTKIPEPVKTTFAVRELFNSLKGLFSSDRITFSYSIEPQNLQLNADRLLIEQVLINLIKNAIEATEDKATPEIMIKAFKENGLPIISVSDNGNGIVSEAIDKVFVPFFTTKNGGSGIGLSICRQIINRHGGSISVRSETEKGTTFKLQFPHTRTIIS
ncbi:signal transduction histidine kinase [Parabacteroides sp. PF5-5]|nr:MULTISPECIES: HAMP domain-containing sensor histidine kinase [unclassified Parabacteroides]MDH6303508.1 signal transduction histidine kinase [Parabacteroides sp. PH5-39]MDH6314830.1 signal transduction histidine kinase [Parabacteroides sp. PF5-13]MDH6318167.1 signal transduction histidine kinase [Parabacteroides sp. PH5-13]MDH6321901.1 signal transduction histidine kinase [Parabacteroides sp. PH5-8]MDH6326025.1 signal transduction histidine kinase [Parabacteroides sp. PH5-41]